MALKTNKMHQSPETKQINTIGKSYPTCEANDGMDYRYSSDKTQDISQNTQEVQDK